MGSVGDADSRRDEDDVLLFIAFAGEPLDDISLQVKDLADGRSVYDRY